MQENGKGRGGGGRLRSGQESRNNPRNNLGSPELVEGQGCDGNEGFPQQFLEVLMKFIPP